jgi:hypothetical protein
MTAHKTTEIPALNIPATAAVPAGTRRLGLALVVTNAGQQIGGAVGLAVIGSVAWTIVNNHVRHSLADESAGHTALPGRLIYGNALTAGVHAALTIGAAATVIALIVTLVAIRVRREDLPESPMPAKAPEQTG